MSHKDTQPKIRVTRADSDGYLVLSVAGDFRCDHHRISLAQARALSLELIKQTYEAELHAHLAKSKTVQTAPCNFRQPRPI